MKKYIKIILFLLVSILSLSIGISANADTGPKPYVKISIVGETDGFYMTLFSKVDSYGPYSVYSKDKDTKEYSSEEEKNAYFAFRNYIDSDGFYYLEYCNLVKENSYSWSYYPPKVFKIYIYDSEKDEVITNDVIYERTEFASIYTLTLNEDSFTVEKNTTNIGNHILGFFIRLLICLSIELLLALAFGFRRLELLPILFVNIITQIGLNAILAYDIYMNGFSLFYIIGHAYILIEIGILIVEFLAYFFIFRKWTFHRERKIHSLRLFLYSLLANVLSFVLGFMIITVLQNIGFYI